MSFINKIEDKWYVGSLLVVLISIFLPWFQLGPLGRALGIQYTSGIIGLVILLGIIGLYFYKKKTSFRLAAITLGPIAIYKIIDLIQTIKESFDPNIIANNITGFIGWGVYIFIVGAISATIVALINLKKIKKSLLINTCIGIFFITLFLLAVMYMIGIGA